MGNLYTDIGKRIDYEKGVIDNIIDELLDSYHIFLDKVISSKGEECSYYFFNNNYDSDYMSRAVDAVNNDILSNVPARLEYCFSSLDKSYHFYRFVADKKEFLSFCYMMNLNDKYKESKEVAKKNDKEESKKLVRKNDNIIKHHSSR